jgi:hypothetical protein
MYSISDIISWVTYLKNLCSLIFSFIFYFIYFYR